MKTNFLKHIVCGVIVLAAANGCSNDDKKNNSIPALTPEQKQTLGDASRAYADLKQAESNKVQNSYSNRSVPISSPDLADSAGYDDDTGPGSHLTPETITEDSSAPAGDETSLPPEEVAEKARLGALSKELMAKVNTECQLDGSLINLFEKYGEDYLSTQLKEKGKLQIKDGTKISLQGEKCPLGGNVNVTYNVNATGKSDQQFTGSGSVEADYALSLTDDKYRPVTDFFQVSWKGKNQESIDVKPSIARMTSQITMNGAAQSVNYGKVGFSLTVNSVEIFTEKSEDITGNGRLDLKFPNFTAIITSTETKDGKSHYQLNGQAISEADLIKMLSEDGFLSLFEEAATILAYDQ